MKKRFRIVRQIELSLSGLPETKYVLEIKRLWFWDHVWSFRERDEAEKAQTEWEKVYEQV